MSDSRVFNGVWILDLTNTFNRLRPSLFGARIKVRVEITKRVNVILKGSKRRSSHLCRN